MKRKEDILKPKLTDNDLFVLYSPPHDANHYLIIQNDPEITDVPEFSEFDGFMINFFQNNETQNPIFIKKDTYLINPYIDFRPQRELERKCVSKQEYLNLAEHFKTHCEEEKFEKIVLSRIKKLYRDNDNLMPLFLSLKQKYSSAFIYLLNVPGHSCWIGATPEILIQKEGNQYQTMALAGTMKAQNTSLDNIIWGQKEIYEQTLVEKYFEGLIREFSSEFKKTGPETKQAGQVLHLCTFFEFESNHNLWKIMESFHPSPAVCGLPKSLSYDFIIKSEPHNRKFYTGFLGPIHKSKSAQLYVNLRCMEVSADNFFLYIGGGITKDSDPLSEWDETELKSLTLQTIIEKMYLYTDVIR